MRVVAAGLPDDLRSARGFAGDLAFSAATAEDGDGRARWYAWDATSTDDDDGINVLKFLREDVGRWKTLRLSAIEVDSVVVGSAPVFHVFRGDAPELRVDAPLEVKTENGHWWQIVVDEETGVVSAVDRGVEP
jgi:hypothetical protein